MELVPLPWDSELFGFSVFRVDGRPDASLLTKLTREENVRCAYHFCSAGDAEAIRSAELAEFRLVDIRVVLEASLGDAANPLPSSVVVDTDVAMPADLGDLRQIAAELSTYSRFAFDPGFGDLQARRLYERWVEVSLDGRADLFVVAREQQRVTGFVTVRDQGKAASLELVAVKRTSAGAGIGTALLRRVRRDLAASGHQRVNVVTQGRNLRALRFYERSGFSVSDVSLVYHRWFDPARST